MAVEQEYDMTFVISDSVMKILVCEDPNLFGRVIFLPFLDPYKIPKSMIEWVLCNKLSIYSGKCFTTKNSEFFTYHFGG